MDDLLVLRRFVIEKVDKIFKKVFGVNNYKDAVHLRDTLKNCFEKKYGREIYNISVDDIESCEYYDFAKYKTLQKIMDLYVDVVALSFRGKDERVRGSVNEC